MKQDINKHEAQLAEIKALLAQQDALLKSIDTIEMREFKEKYPELDEAIHRETKAVLREEGLLAPEQAKIKTMGAKRRNYI